MQEHDEREMYCPACGCKQMADHTIGEEMIWKDHRAYNIFNCDKCGRESQIFLMISDDDKALKEGK